MIRNSGKFLESIQKKKIPRTITEWSRLKRNLVPKKINCFVKLLESVLFPAAKFGDTSKKTEI